MTDPAVAMSTILRLIAGQLRPTAGAITVKLFGDAGNDKLNCNYGKGGDTINGGPGTDTCMGDKKDVFVGCEKITRT